MPGTASLGKNPWFTGPRAGLTTIILPHGHNIKLPSNNLFYIMLKIVLPGCLYMYHMLA